MKVLLLPRWYPNRTDPQLGVFIQKHARAIATLHEATVFFAVNDPEMVGKGIELQRSETGGLSEYRYYYAHADGFFGKVKNTFRYLRCWMRFRNDVGLYRHGGYHPDLIHAYIILRTVLIGLLTGMIRKTPFVVSEQWSGYVSGEYQRLGWLRRNLIRFSLRYASGLSAVSFFLKGHMESCLGRKDIRVIHNIIEPEIPVPAVRTAPGIRIALVADLVDAIKNISDVVRCMPSLTEKFPGIRLDIIGGGRDESALKHLAAQLGLTDTAICFHGRMPNDAVYRLLVDSDFLVMNSRFETFSLICAEAVRCGKPVVATRCGGPEEIIHEGNGILIPTGDAVALAEAMERMCATYGTYNGATLKAEAATKYSMSAAARGFDEWYRTSIDDGNRKGPVPGK